MTRVHDKANSYQLQLGIKRSEALILCKTSEEKKWMSRNVLNACQRIRANTWIQLRRAMECITIFYVKSVNMNGR